MIRGRAGAIEAAHSEAACFEPATTGKPIEAEPRALFHARERGTPGPPHHAQHPARLRQTRKSKPQGRLPVHEARPLESVMAQDVEQRFARGALVGAQQTALERAVRQEQERQGSKQRIPGPTSVEGVRVEITGERHRTDFVLERLQQGAHLQGPQRPRAMDREVHRNRHEWSARALDRGDQADVPPVHALVSELLAVRARQLDHARLADRPARQDRLPEQGFLVVGDRGLDEERRPDPVEAKCCGQLARDVAISGARHPEIHLVEQHHVRLLELRMAKQRVLHLLVAIPVLDVPVHGPHALRVDGRPGRGVGREPAHGVEQPLDPVAQRGPRGCGVQDLDRGEGAEQALDLLAFRNERAVGGHVKKDSRGGLARCAERVKPLD